LESAVKSPPPSRRTVVVPSAGRGYVGGAAGRRGACTLLDPDSRARAAARGGTVGDPLEDGRTAASSGLGEPGSTASADACLCARGLRKDDAPALVGGPRHLARPGQAPRCGRRR